MDKTAKVIDSKYMTGSEAEKDATQGMSTPSYRTPGKTVRLYGVEANTARTKGSPQRNPNIGVTEITYGVSAPVPFDTFGDD